MKKLLNISVIAALAILPFAANAAVSIDKDPGATNANGPVATNGPKYSLAATAGTDETNVATASYVKGAYNAAIKAINKVATTADSAVKGVQVNGADLTLTNGVANVTVAEGATNGTVAVNGTDVAVHGLGTAAYTSADAYATAAQGAKADTALQAADLADYATHDGVENTIETATITATVPTVTEWGTETTSTASVTVSRIVANYAEPAGE